MRRARTTLLERAEKAAARLVEFKAKKAAERAAAQLAESQRALVNDATRAVPLRTLPLNTRVKTPDDLRIGVHGVTFTLRAMSPSCATISRTDRLGDYISLETLVVLVDGGQEALAL
jgi:hypothetical protein